MKDLEFISGNFFDLEIPKDKRYLLKYFKTDLQVAFLKYYLVFGCVLNFVDHTGHYCSRRMLYKMKDKLKRLLDVHASAKLEFTEENIELLQLIESGNYKFTKDG